MLILPSIAGVRYKIFEVSKIKKTVLPTAPEVLLKRRQKQIASLRIRDASKKPVSF